MQFKVTLTSGAEETFTGYLVGFEVDKPGALVVSTEDANGREIGCVCYAPGRWLEIRMTVPMTPAQAKAAMDEERY